MSARDDLELGGKHYMAERRYRIRNNLPTRQDEAA